MIDLSFVMFYNTIPTKTLYSTVCILLSSLLDCISPDKVQIVDKGRYFKKFKISFGFLRKKKYLCFVCRYFLSYLLFFNHIFQVYSNLIYYIYKMFSTFQIVELCVYKICVNKQKQNYCYFFCLLEYVPMTLSLFSYYK